MGEGCGSIMKAGRSGEGFVFVRNSVTAMTLVLTDAACLDAGCRAVPVHWY